MSPPARDGPARARRVARLVAVFAAALAAGPRAAPAQEIGIGWEGSARDGYAFASLELPRDLGGRGEGLLRLEGNRVRYRLAGDPAGSSLDSRGLSLGLGFRGGSERWTFEIVPGFEVRRSEQAADSTAPSSTTSGGLAAQAGLSIEGNALRFDVDALHSRLLDYTWMRASLAGHHVRDEYEPPAIALAGGPEATLEVADGEVTLAAGGLAALEFPGAGFTLELRAGSTRLRYDDTWRVSGPYFGLGLSREF